MPSLHVSKVYIFFFPHEELWVEKEKEKENGSCAPTAGKAHASVSHQLFPQAAMVLSISLPQGSGCLCEES